MKSERWRAARALFDEALALPEADRAGFLARRSGDDPELAAEVESLLDSLGRADGFLEEAAVAGFATAAAGPEAGPRAMIGPWRIAGELGRGGMGVVYLGERATGDFAQRVAIKVVSGGAANREIVRRFETERRILATLEHPGIARLLDGGTTDDGLPYFVLEQVEGENLLEWAEGQRLGLAERLALFLEVCAAVEYAHRRLVVHRDLKPGNILVGRDGHAKLLDFGIAKLLEPGVEAGAPAPTVTAGRFLTPAYASPEQIRGEPTTTATDVYSLGVVLFELLVGSPPFPAAGKSAAALEREVLELEPPRPSAARLARRSSEADARFARALAGDLDTIVGKALTKESGRRYGSVAELAADVERHLAGRPVAARPDSFAYRAGKFLSRHRLGVGVAAAAAAALVAGLVLALLGTLRAQRAEAVARAEAETAERVSEFLVGLFSINDPGEARGNAVTARELLDRGAARAGEELAGQPAVRARLLRVMGRAYGALGLYEPGLAALDAALAAEERLHGVESVEVARTLTRLSELQMRRGAYAEQRALAERALAIQERLGAPEDLDLASTLSQLGLAQWYLGDLAAARSTLERALALRERLQGPEHVDLGGILNNVANLRWQLGDPAGARPLYERALAIFEREYGEEHPYVAHTINNLALAHQQEGDLDAARALQQRALAIRRRLLASDHPDLGESLNNLGEVERLAGDLDAAREHLDAALALRERVLGPEHPDVATTLHNLGSTFLARGELAAARPHFERAVAIFTRAVGPEHFFVGYPLGGLAQVEARAGDPSADATFERALALMARGLGAEHPDVVALRRERAEILRGLGRAEEADQLERAAPAIPGT